jgi:pSer/pThr/pTyr-binding forkhead associated (FHA) protein
VEPNCRTCPERVRERCIEGSSNSPSVKTMIRRAFEAGSDTEQTWGLLRMNCLLMPRRGAAKPPSAPAKEAPPVQAPVRPAEPKHPSPAVGVSAEDREPSPPAPAVSAPAEPKKPAPQTSVSRFALVLAGSHHLIALPTDGQLVLGRFDPSMSSNPDIDLSYDDREQRAISRRHARILVYEGHHLIEDMGSTNGTMVNMTRLKIGQKVMLQPGDRVLFGDHRFYYRPAPEMQTTGDEPLAAYLWATFTGQRFSLPPFGEMIVGRNDPVIGFRPDIDLSDEEEVAAVVARRHVKITARENRHYVEDMGSANGTKLNGAVMQIGERGLLEPGDHLWLGGCVLAYDIES